MLSENIHGRIGKAVALRHGSAQCLGVRHLYVVAIGWCNGIDLIRSSRTLTSLGRRCFWWWWLCGCAVLSVGGEIIMSRRRRYLGVAICSLRLGRSRQGRRCRPLMGRLAILGRSHRWGRMPTGSSFVVVAYSASRGQAAAAGGRVEAESNQRSMVALAASAPKARQREAKASPSQSNHSLPLTDFHGTQKSLSWLPPHFAATRFSAGEKAPPPIRWRRGPPLSPSSPRLYSFFFFRLVVSPAYSEQSNCLRWKRPLPGGSAVPQCRPRTRRDAFVLRISISSMMRI